MGNTKSTTQDVTEDGVVNSNFIVQEQVLKSTLDVKIMMGLMVLIMVAQLLLKLCKMHRSQVKRTVRRNLAASMASVTPV